MILMSFSDSLSESDNDLPKEYSQSIMLENPNQSYLVRKANLINAKMSAINIKNMQIKIHSTNSDKKLVNTQNIKTLSHFDMPVSSTDLDLDNTFHRQEVNYITHVNKVRTIDSFFRENKNSKLSNISSNLEKGTPEVEGNNS
jgi:hypothetical protein